MHQKNKAVLELEESIDVEQTLDTYNVLLDQRHLVMANGV